MRYDELPADIRDCLESILECAAARHSGDYAWLQAQLERFAINAYSAGHALAELSQLEQYRTLLRQ